MNSTASRMRIRSSALRPDQSCPSERSLSAWRQALFDRLLGAVVLLILAGFSLAAAILCALFWRGLPFEITGGLFLVGTAAAFTILRYSLSAVARRRPHLEDAPVHKPGAALSVRPAESQ